MEDLIAAFSELSREERHAIAYTAGKVRDERAEDPARWSQAWARVYALVSAAAYGAQAKEDRAFYDIRRGEYEARQRRHGGTVFGPEPEALSV
jgi:hypothetical protein